MNIPVGAVPYTVIDNRKDDFATILRDYDVALNSRAG
jgi:hypothetical protein